MPNPGNAWTGTSKDAERTRTRYVYEQVCRYCEARSFCVGGLYSQESYNLEFFTIYCRARQLNLTGALAGFAFDERQRGLKRKRLCRDDYVVSRQSLREYLEVHFLSQTDSPKDVQMVEDLCAWWDAWNYAMDRYPGDPDKAVPSTPQPPMSDAELAKYRHSPGFVMSHPRDRLPRQTDNPLWKNWPR